MATPGRLLRESAGLVFIDEVQRLPQLLETLRPICDDPGRRAVFLLLSSASWSMVRGVSETLAGRVLFVDMGGLLLAEVGPENQDRLWMRGGFPRAYLARSTEAWSRWVRSFTRTFLERDVPSLDVRVAPDALGRFWRMLAHSHGQAWNASRLAGSMGLGVRAVNRYRDLLAGAFMIRVLPSWLENLGKRIVKAPKVYIRDSGVLHALLGLEERDDLFAHPQLGARWEGFAIEQTLRVFGERESYSYCTQRGAELDLMLIRRGRRLGFEFKCTDAPRTTRSMHLVTKDLGLAHLWVLYPGDRQYPLAERMTALPLKQVVDLDLPAPGKKSVRL